MQSFHDLICSECQSEFKSASSLLQHFALHATNSLIKTVNTNENNKTVVGLKKSKVPDLYPINSKNKIFNNNSKQETDIESDSGIEDLNPLKFCLVTMEAADNKKDDPKKHCNNIKESPVNRKYQCIYCPKNFGWSTDLKRHIMTHTGERPFSCHLCNSSFTRNFLLQKHLLKMHHHSYYNESSGIPDLKPICSVNNSKLKLRKQEKSKIKRNYNRHQTEVFERKCNLICTN